MSARGNLLAGHEPKKNRLDIVILSIGSIIEGSVAIQIVHPGFQSRLPCYPANKVRRAEVRRIVDWPCARNLIDLVDIFTFQETALQKRNVVKNRR